MSAGALTSNHVNYLIWRYLQESGHGEAAVKLQRDWIADPQTLPFAQHIKTHALVALVQKGLQYYEIEQSIIQNGTRSSLSSSTSFFGPRSVRATLSPKEDVSEEEAASTSQFSPRTRKHGRDSTANGLLLDLPIPAPPAKRSRRSNGTEGTNGDGRGSESMDYELNAIANASVSVSVSANASANANTNANDPNGTAHGNGNGNGNGNENGNGNGNGQSRPEGAEPTSNINSPAEESQSQSQSQLGADGAGGMDVDVDVDDDAAAAEQQHNNIYNNKQQQQQQQQQEEEEDDEQEEEELEQEQEQNQDQDQDQQQEQQEHEHEHDEHDEHDARMTLTLTNGRSVGVQSESDKVAELGPETITLTVPDKNVLHTAWNPRDAAILATGGDALCRIWKAESYSPSGPGEPQYVDTLDASDDSLVTAMAWSPDGNLLAVCTRSDTLDWSGAVSLWAKTGKSIDELPAAQDTVLIFRWNPSGTHLLGITSSGRGTSALVVWDTRSSHALPPFQLDSVITDAAWLDDKKFLICGHGIVAESIVDDGAIAGFHTRDDVDTKQRWTNIEYDTATRTIAFVAEESAMLAIVDSSSSLHTTTAHSAEITALAFQPLASPSAYSPASPRLLVTSSLDGNIKVWDARNPFTTIHILSLGRAVPAMTISFTPDGFLVAAVNWNRILIWNAEAGGLPKASWDGGLGKWQALTNGVDQDSGIGEEEDGPTHSLSWDADGKKLAYGLGNQISIINFRP